MNKHKQSNAPARMTFVAAMVAVAIGGLASTLFSAEPMSDTPSGNNPAAATNAVESKAVSPDTNDVAVKMRLTGAELYSMHCNRCHPERYPTERTAAQWKTIMLHMQVRANIPVSQSKLILQYLQDNSGR